MERGPVRKGCTRIVESDLITTHAGACSCFNSWPIILAAPPRAPAHAHLKSSEYGDSLTKQPRLPTCDSSGPSHNMISSFKQDEDDGGGGKDDDETF